MRAVHDRQERLAVLVAESGTEARLRDPDSGAERTIAASAIEPVDWPGRPPRAVGLLLVLAARERRVRELLDGWGLCESDLHGAVGDLRAAGLVAATSVDGEPGYRLTDAGVQAVADHT